MIRIKEFYKEVKQEALKITWPAKPEVITTTIMVFLFVFVGQADLNSLILSAAAFHIDKISEFRSVCPPKNKNNSKKKIL